MHPVTVHVGDPVKVPILLILHPIRQRRLDHPAGHVAILVGEALSGLLSGPDGLPHVGVRDELFLHRLLDGAGDLDIDVIPGPVLWGEVLSPLFQNRLFHFQAVDPLFLQRDVPAGLQIKDHVQHVDTGLLPLGKHFTAVDAVNHVGQIALIGLFVGKIVVKIRVGQHNVAAVAAAEPVAQAEQKADEEETEEVSEEDAAAGLSALFG